MTTQAEFLAARKAAEKLLRETMAPCYPSFQQHLPVIIEALVIVGAEVPLLRLARLAAAPESRSRWRQRIPPR